MRLARLQKLGEVNMVDGKVVVKLNEGLTIDNTYLFIELKRIAGKLCREDVQPIGILLAQMDV